MSGQIRNISQSTQYRDVIKQASDTIVYIDGQDYLINPFLGASGLPVPLNNFTNSWQATYDIDAMVPSGVLTLVVPVQLASMFHMPGGNYLLKSMSEIRVFQKGYYLSARGNSVYHQTFKGFISSINYVPSGMTLTITLNCFGSLGILEKMQTDQSPGIMSNSPMPSVPFTSTTYGLDAYQQIAWVFLYASMVDGFDMYSLQQAAMVAQGGSGTDAGNAYFGAMENGYMAKWQTYLLDLARDVHVFGSAQGISDLLQYLNENIKHTAASATPWNKEAMGVFADLISRIKESDQVQGQQNYYEQLRGYMPEMGFTSIQLFNGRLTSRLERLRALVSLVGFEAYQDVDGAVVVKTPLYNLDVVNLANTSDQNIDSSLSWITDSTNPFVVRLSEILHESETEDEAGVRLTRFLAQGSATKQMQGPNMQQYLAVAEEIDLPKLQQFGLRTEPLRSCPWLEQNDGAAVFAFAASELARANRGFRHYTCTIPLRPELKLGFPMFFPHKDIYGYIKTISMSWNKGADATTSITVDTLRRRPLFPETQNVPVPNTTSQTSSQFLTQQPNLVLQWCKPPEVVGSSSSQALQLEGTACSLPQPPTSSTLPFPDLTKVVTPQDQQMEDTMRKAGLYYGANPDDSAHAWYIQKDKQSVFDHERPIAAAPAGTTGTAANDYYEALRTFRPYTDQKGYELVGPFPWGRWKSLKDSLTVFTISNYIFGNTNIPQLLPSLTPVSAETGLLTNADAFLFTGDSQAASTESASALQDALATQKNLVQNCKVFELAYTSDPTNVPGPGSSLSPMAPAIQAADPTAGAVQTMLAGQETTQSFTTAILQTVKPTSSG